MTLSWLSCVRALYWIGGGGGGGGDVEGVGLGGDTVYEENGSIYITKNL